MAEQGTPRDGVEQVRVTFAGTGAGVADLTWGQQEIRRQMREHRSWIPIGTVLPLPPGATVADVAADLRWLMSRYPTLRTRWTFGPERAYQRVFDEGTITLDVVDAPDDADPARYSLELWQQYFDRDFDFAAEWPVRMAVVRHRGVPCRRLWMMCHLTTDGTGARVLVEEFADRSDRTAATAAPPLEQARWQRSPAGRRQSRLALRYWEGALRRVPARMFPAPAHHPDPRYWRVELRSPAVHLAVRTVLAHTGVESSTALLACFVIAVARVTDTGTVATRVAVNNRFRPGLARTVSPIAQNGLVVMEVPTSTLGDAILAVRRNAIVAYKNAYYDYHERDALIALVGEQRGEPVDLPLFFNDRRITPRDDSGPPPDPERVREAAHESRLTWGNQQNAIPFAGLHANIEDDAGTVRVSMLFDTHQVPPSLVEACLWEMQRVALAAALTPGSPVRDAPP